MGAFGEIPDEYGTLISVSGAEPNSHSSTPTVADSPDLGESVRREP